MFLMHTAKVPHLARSKAEKNSGPCRTRKVLGWGLAAVIAPFAFPSIAHSQEKVSAPGRYSGYSAKLYDDWDRTSFHVPVRDGTRLAVDLFRPVKDGKIVESKLPVVWIHTPYLGMERRRFAHMVGYALRTALSELLHTIT
jgi:hypothetical protein